MLKSNYFTKPVRALLITYEKPQKFVAFTEFAKLKICTIVNLCIRSWSNWKSDLPKNSQNTNFNFIQSIFGNRAISKKTAKTLIYALIFLFS